MCKRFREELRQKPPWPWLTDTCSGAKKQSGIGLLQARVCLFFFYFFFYWFLSSNRADGVGLQKSKLMKTKMVACQPVFASISKEEHKHCLRELLFPSKTNELLKCHGSAILLIYIKGVLLVNLKWSVINEKWFLLPVLELGCGVHCAGFWGTESFLKEKKKEFPVSLFPGSFKKPIQHSRLMSSHHIWVTFSTLLPMRMRNAEANTLVLFCPGTAPSVAFFCLPCLAVPTVTSLPPHTSSSYWKVSQRCVV